MEIQFNNTTNFKSYKSKFSQSLDKAIVDKLYYNRHKKTLIDDFTKMHNHRIKKNKLGSGCFSTVYKIDDKYVLKKGNGTKKIQAADILINNSPTYKKLKCYFGESIATIVNSFGTNLHILRNAYSKGNVIPAGIPKSIADKNSYNMSLDYYKKTYLPVFSAIPQRSFDNLIKDCAMLNKMSKSNKTDTTLVFDYLNPNNFVLAGKTLRIIDEIGHASQKEKKNSVSDLFSVFLSNFDLDYTEATSPEIVNYRRILAKKIILAGIKHQLPMSDSKQNYAIWIEGISSLNLNMSDKEVINMAKELEHINKNRNPKKRVDLAHKYLDYILKF